MTERPVTYAKTVYSPSQISMAHACFRSWLLRYVLGNKPPELTTRGKVFGVLIHNCLACFLRGGKVSDGTLDTLTENDRKDVARYADQLAAERGREYAEKELAAMLADAPQRALTGLPLLPSADSSRVRLVEVPIKLDTRPLHRFGAAIQLSDWSRMDLVVQRVDGVWYVFDHKSTAGDESDPWAYVPTSEELANDVALLLYAASVMQVNGLGEIWCRWVYYYSGRRFAPQAKPVDVHVAWADCAARLQPYFDTCDKMSTEIKRALTLKRLPVLEAHPFPVNVLELDRPCDKYGKGCAYRDSLCNPPKIPLEKLAQKKQRKKEKNNMGLGERVTQMQSNGYVQTPAANTGSAGGVPQVAPHAQHIAIPPGHAPVLDSAGNLIGWQPIAPAVASPVYQAPAPVAAPPAPPPVGSPTLPAGDPVGAGLTLPGTPAAEPAPAPAEPAPAKRTRASKTETAPATTADGRTDQALALLRGAATDLKAVVEVKITFDGGAA